MLAATAASKRSARARNTKVGTAPPSLPPHLPTDDLLLQVVHRQGRNSPSIPPSLHPYIPTGGRAGEGATACATFLHPCIPTFLQEDVLARGLPPELREVRRALSDHWVMVMSAFDYYAATGANPTKPSDAAIDPVGGIYIHAYMHACIHAYMHTCIHVYMHTCIHAHMHTCTHAYMHTCIHVYMHTCTHAHMHTFRCGDGPRRRYERHAPLVN